MAFFEAFGVDWLKLGFQVVNFLIVLYLLNRFLFRRVLTIIDERQNRITTGLENAEAAARDRELARAEREAAVAEARTEGQAMVARASKAAEAARDEILATARTEAARLTEQARNEIVAERDRAIAELRGQVADLALDAATQLVRAQMDGPTQRRLVEGFLAETVPADESKN
jgi:F-type H+-transporting ATPase subunit b